jgi:hypothetical protein
MSNRKIFHIQTDWFLSIIRIAGSSFPVASSFVQFQAEIDSKVLDKRIAKLEDPVSSLHNDVPMLSQNIYQKLKIANSINLDFDEEFYQKYSRPLAALNSQGFIGIKSAITKKYPLGIKLVDPSYIMYLCSLDKDNNSKMEMLISTVDNVQIGEWLNGNNLHISIGLPIPVIQAVFSIFESKGYGLCSKNIGSCQYMGKA